MVVVYRFQLINWCLGKLVVFVMCVKRFLKVLTVSTVKRRHFSSAICVNKTFNMPPSANELPRPAGISSMFRLPVVSNTQGTLSAILSLIKGKNTVSVRLQNLTKFTEINVKVMAVLLILYYRPRKIIYHTIFGSVYG